MGKKNDDANTIEINPKLATIATFDEKIITDAGFKLVYVSMDGEATLSRESMPEIVVDDKYRIGITQSLRQRYYIPRICDNFTKRIKVIKNGLPVKVSVSIRTFTISKGRTKYNFRVYGQATKTVILKSRNTVAYEQLDVGDVMAELAELFESTCRLVPGKYKDPMRCGLSIK